MKVDRPGHSGRGFVHQWNEYVARPQKPGR